MRASNTELRKTNLYFTDKMSICDLNTTYGDMYSTVGLISYGS